MKRITSDNIWEREMHRLALNQACIKQDGWAWHQKQSDIECSVCDLIRAAAETLHVELPILSDRDLSGLMAEFQQYGEAEPEGVLGILYSALCALAEARAHLAACKDTGLEPEEIMALPAPPRPLTPAELREMDEAWVWIELQVPLYGMGSGYYIKRSRCSDMEKFCCGYPNVVIRDLPYALYGDTWIAYRCKPEGLTHAEI